MVFASWEKNKSQIKIYSDKRLKAIIEQLYVISMTKNKKNLLYCLIISEPK